MFTNVQSFADWIYKMTGINEKAGYEIATNLELKKEYQQLIQEEMEMSKLTADEEKPGEEEKAQEEEPKATEKEPQATVEPVVKTEDAGAVEQEPPKTDIQDGGVDPENQDDEIEKFENELSSEDEDEKEQRRFQSDRRIGN
jgi:hypothetical protein